jgi:hypothetical protein
MTTENKLTNYLPVNRKLFQHSLWKEQRTYSKFEAWLDLLQNARFESSEAKMLIGCKMVKWGRGQMPASLRFLATRWDWSTKKVTSFLSLLESEKMIKKETVKETGQTIITICKYDSYNVQGEYKKQQKKQEGNSEETARKHEGNETNKEEEYKEGELPAGEPEHSPEVINKFNAFTKWIAENAPRVNQLKKPFTIDEYLKAREKIPNLEQMTKLLLKMQNWSPLLKNNQSSYLTLLSWYERDTPDITKAEAKEKQLMKSIGL